MNNWIAVALWTAVLVWFAYIHGENRYQLGLLVAERKCAQDDTKETTVYNIRGAGNRLTP